MRIFLDFDGVLHPVGGKTLPFEHLPLFEELLREYPDALVVITSSWREVFGVDYIRETFFSADIQHRIIGGTPSLPEGNRFDEIQAYLQLVGYEGEYVVVDDDSEQFPANWPHLVLCDSKSGMDSTSVQELLSHLARKGREG